MKTLRILATLVAVLLWPSFAGAQQTIRALYERFDVTATSYTYALLAQPRPCNGSIETSGSSTTVTATTGTPFAGLAAKDVIIIPNAATPNAPTVRSIATATSSTSVVVDAAVTLSAGTACSVASYGATSGTGAENGWIGVGGRSTITITVETLNATSIDYSIEYRSPPTTTIPLTGSISSATAGSNSKVFQLPSIAGQVRVGLKVNTATGVQIVNVTLASDPRFNAAGIDSVSATVSGAVTVSGTATTTPVRTATSTNDGTCTSVTTTTTVLAANATRLGAIILAPAANTQITYIKLAATATTSDFPLIAGASISLTGSSIYTGIIDAIAASGTQSICVLEW